MSTSSNLVCGILNAVSYVKNTPRGHVAFIDDGNSYRKIPLDDELPPHLDYPLWKAIRDICREYRDELPFES